MKNILILRHNEIDSTKITSILSGKYEITAVSNLDEACSAISKLTPDVVICSEAFLDTSDADISSKLKGNGTKLLALLSESRTEPYDIVQNGVDDVIFTPFCEAELLTRLGALTSEKKITENKSFRNGQMTIDYENCRVFIGEHQLHLTMLEYKLLCSLSKNCGKAVSYNTLLRELWQTPIGNEILSLRVFVNAIRKKITGLGDQTSYIQTQTGVGYVMPTLN